MNLRNVSVCLVGQEPRPFKCSYFRAFLSTTLLLTGGRASPSLSAFSYKFRVLSWVLFLHLAIANEALQAPAESSSSSSSHSTNPHLNTITFHELSKLSLVGGF